MKFKKVLDFLVENAEIKVVPRKAPEKAHDHEHPEHAPAAEAPKEPA
jgi:hypothetical protein